MNIWHLTPDAEHYYQLQSVETTDLHLGIASRLFTGESMLNTWFTMAIQAVQIEDAQVPPIDFVGFFTKIVVFSDRAKTLLTDFLGSSIELLPLDLTKDDRQIFLLNVMTVFDCLDRDKSNYLAGENDRILMIMKHVFKPNSVDAPPLFRLAKDNHFIYATDEFRDFIDQHELKGLDFCELH